MGRRTGLDMSFEDLQKDYATNERNDEWVDCLNQLPATERNLMIQFIEYGCYYTKLAKYHNISVPLLRVRIQDIRNHIKEIYERRYK